MRKIMLVIAMLIICNFALGETTYYKNGNIKMESNLVDGTGTYKYYAKDGNLVESGSYKNNNLDGIVTFYNKGKITGKTTYKDNLKTGKYINYYGNGNIKEEGNYLAGKETGKVITYYENGQIKYSIGYTDGVRNGKTIGYYKNGQLMETGNFRMGYPVGKSYLYYSNGKIHYESDIRGELTYNQDGSIDIMRTMKSGEVEGTVTEYTKILNRKVIHKLERK